MKVIEKGVVKILKDEAGEYRNYLNFLENESNGYSDDNLVLDLTEVGGIDNENILQFLPWARPNRESGKSFVVVTTAVDIDEVPEELSVVPTLGEAEDLIEMEEIERDLGF